jgi:hypothetical protein
LRFLRLNEPAPDSPPLDDDDRRKVVHAEVRHEFRPVVDRYAVDGEGLVVASPLQHLREKAVCPP